jgi:hypothetical protein
MAETVASYAQSTFTSPIIGETKDPAVILANDNNLRTKFNNHDADGGIHLQSSALASRPAAGAGNTGWKWLSSDGLRLYYSNGSAWSEIQYLSLAAGGTVAGATTFSAGLTVSSGTTAVQALTATSLTTTAAVSMSRAGTVAVVDNTLAAADYRAVLDARRGGSTRWFLGMNSSDQFVLLDSTGANANVTVTDAGALTTRAGLTATTGTFSSGGNVAIGDVSGVLRWRNNGSGALQAVNTSNAIGAIDVGAITATTGTFSGATLTVTSAGTTWFETQPASSRTLVRRQVFITDGTDTGYLEVNTSTRLQSVTAQTLIFGTAATDRWGIAGSGGAGVVGNLYPAVDDTYDIGTTTSRVRRTLQSQMVLVDGIVAPSAITGHAVIYVDTADGDLKVKFADGTTKTIATDT